MRRVLSCSRALVLCWRGGLARHGPGRVALLCWRESSKKRPRRRAAEEFFSSKVEMAPGGGGASAGPPKDFVTSRSRPKCKERRLACRCYPRPAHDEARGEGRRCRRRVASPVRHLVRPDGQHLLGGQRLGRGPRPPPPAAPPRRGRGRTGCDASFGGGGAARPRSLAGGAVRQRSEVQEGQRARGGGG